MDIRTSNKITYLYLMMSGMIFYLHGVVIDRYDVAEWVIYLNRFTRVLCNVSVPTFFFVSAMLLYRKINRKYDDLILNRVKTLLVPYLAWSIILTVVRMLKGEYTVKTFTSFLFDLMMAKNNSVLWFLRVLFICILLFPVLKRLIKYKWVCFATIVFVILINVWIGATVGYSTVRYWLPVYILGAYVGMNSWDNMFSRKFFREKWKYGLVIFIVLCLVLLGTISEVGLYVCRMLCPILFWILADVFMIQRRPSVWMKQNFFFYCSQLLVTSIASKLHIVIFGNKCMSAVLATLSIPVLMFFILILLYSTIEKFAPRLTSILTGMRS